MRLLPATAQLKLAEAGRRRRDPMMTIKKVTLYSWLTAACVAITLAAFVPQRHALAQTAENSSARYSFQSVGVVSGQQLRVSVSLPKQLPPGPCRINMIDTFGNVIATSGDFTLTVGQTAYFDFPWSELAGLDINGNPVNQLRAQVRAVVLISSRGQLPPGPCMPSVEILDAGTLETKALVTPPQPELF